MNYRILSLFIVFLICIVIIILLNTRCELNIFCTHFFYLAGIQKWVWYSCYNVFFVIAMGLIHIKYAYKNSDSLKFGFIINNYFYKYGIPNQYKN